MARDRKPSAIVEVEGLTKVYQPSPLWMRALLRSPVREPIVALEEVTFAIEAGEICAVVGPNGAGKSTLFRILVGLTSADGGAARVLGLDPVRDGARLRRRVGYTPADDRSLYLRHTCWHNLAFQGRLQGIPERELPQRIDESLALVGLSHARDYSGFALSAGMRARLQLARALLHRPRVLILDEPTGTIDPLGAYELLEAIRRIAAERSIGVLISSHRLDEIEALHDHVLLLDRGRVVYNGNLDVMRRRWERRKLELQCRDVGAAHRIADVLSGVSDVEVLGGEAERVVVGTTRAAGEVLTYLGDDRLREVVEVNESRMALRDLLTAVYQSARGEAAAASVPPEEADRPDPHSQPERPPPELPTGEVRVAYGESLLGVTAEEEEQQQAPPPARRDADD